MYGVPRRQVALFEKHVQQLAGGRGRIDLFWPGKVIAEHMTRGESLDKAQTQAFGYAAALTTTWLAWFTTPPSRMPGS